METKFKTLEVKEENSILEVCLNRPEIHNAFDEQMIFELTKVFSQITSQEHLRLVLLKGNGKSFSAGADLNWMKKMKDYTNQENLKDAKELSNMFEVMNNCPIPLVAVTHGLALGGGVGLVSVCDYVSSVETMKFGLTEVVLGLLPAVISPFVFSKIGESNARAYFLSGEKFDAKKALAMNLIHSIIDDSSDSFEGEIRRLKKVFLKASPNAARECKRLINEIKKSNFAIDSSMTQKTGEFIANIRVTSEAQEGMNALLEKRKPQWMK